MVRVHPRLLPPVETIRVSAYAFLLIPLSDSPVGHSHFDAQAKNAGDKILSVRNFFK